MKDPRFQRDTRQRRVILEELRKATDHPRAIEVYERVRRRLPTISLGTVYRNLDLFAQCGTIQKLHGGGSETRFDGNPDGHQHVRCICCGRIEDAHGLPAPTVDVGTRELRGYQILGCVWELFGVCPKCRGKGPTSDMATPRGDAPDTDR